MNPALSRRVALVMAYEPILSMGLPDALRFPHVVEEANDFGDLPERYQQIILAAGAARERAIAELRREKTGQIPDHVESGPSGRRAS